MSETALSYNPERFLFAGILTNLTEVAEVAYWDPVRAYRMMRRMRKAAGLYPCPDFGSTARTTGGYHRRLGMDGAEAARANVRIAQNLAATMDGQGVIEPDRLLLSADLGPISHWTGWQHLQAALLTISGIDLRKKDVATYYEAYDEALNMKPHDVQLDVMEDTSQDLECRAEQYLRFAGACATALSSIGRPCQPVSRVLSLVDTENSLECLAEAAFARAMGVPVYRIQAMQPASDTDKALPSQGLRDAAAEIMDAGGTFAGAAEYPALVLMRDEPAMTSMPTRILPYIPQQRRGPER